jgi:hypothetical protein
MINITQEDWEAYEGKFGGLISFISHRITGDPMLCDFESNVQDLRVAAINSIVGYYKKNKITIEDKPVTEVIECPLFKAYTKTVLWNAKNHKGNKATKYKNFMPISLDTLENKEDLVYDESTSNAYENEDLLGVLSKKFNDEERAILAYVVNNPEVVRDSGKVNYNRIAVDTGSSFYRVKKTFTELMGKLNGE